MITEQEKREAAKAMQRVLKARLLERANARRIYARHGAAAYNMPVTGWNPESPAGIRWIESLSGAGLRFVAWADEVIRLGHNGWFTDSDGMNGETLRGCVLQIPSRHGIPVYLAAYADPVNDDAFRVDTRTLYYGEKGGENFDSSARGMFSDGMQDAARAADHFAEKTAESERNYNEAWRMGARYASLRDEVRQDKETARALIAEIKAAGKTFPPEICATLRARLIGLRRDITKARAEASKLADPAQYNAWWISNYGDAFDDGAGESVLKGASHANA